MKQQKAFKKVYKTLMKWGPDTFKGKYDGKNGTDVYMYGIQTVMEFIAENAGENTVNEFDTLFYGNMIESEKRAKKKKKKDKE